MPFCKACLLMILVSLARADSFYDECVRRVVQTKSEDKLHACLDRNWHQKLNSTAVSRSKRAASALPGFCTSPCHRERMAYPLKLVHAYIKMKYGFKISAIGLNHISLDEKRRETLDIGVCVGNCKGKRGISSRQACIPTGYEPIAVFKPGIQRSYLTINKLCRIPQRLMVKKSLFKI